MLVQGRIEWFDVDGNDILALEDDTITYYGLESGIDKEDMDINWDLQLKLRAHDPYSYIKADRHRIGLMSQQSLLFKNHGEINQTGN